jgi:hypothetical protein
MVHRVMDVDEETKRIKKFQAIAILITYEIFG